MTVLVCVYKWSLQNTMEDVCLQQFQQFRQIYCTLKILKLMPLMYVHPYSCTQSPTTNHENTQSLDTQNKNCNFLQAPQTCLANMLRSRNFWTNCKEFGRNFDFVVVVAQFEGFQSESESLSDDTECILVV